MRPSPPFHLAALAALLLATSVHATGLSAGSRALDEGDLSGAYEAWRPLAETGDAAAQFNIGLLYERIVERQIEGPSDASLAGLPAEDGISGNVIRAFAWYAAAARGRLVDAAHSRDRLARRLSRNERAAAHRWAVALAEAIDGNRTPISLVLTR